MLNTTIKYIGKNGTLSYYTLYNINIICSNGIKTRGLDKYTYNIRFTVKDPVRTSEIKYITNKHKIGNSGIANAIMENKIKIFEIIFR